MHLQSTYTLHLQHIQSDGHLESSRASTVDLFCGYSQLIKVVGYFCKRAPSWMFGRTLNTTLPSNSLLLHQKLAIFPRMFGEIPRNVWGHSPECLAAFPGMFNNIPHNVWGHFSKCLVIFPGMFGDIPQNITFPPFPRVPRIPFPVPVFLVLYIAPLVVTLLKSHFGMCVLL